MSFINFGLSLSKISAGIKNKMSMKRRVEKLEQEHGADVPSFVYVSWDEQDSIPDDEIISLSNGLLMTYAEVKRRYPEMDNYYLVWGDDDTMTLIREE